MWSGLGLRLRVREVDKKATDMALGVGAWVWGLRFGQAKPFLFGFGIGKDCYERLRVKRNTRFVLLKELARRDVGLKLSSFEITHCMTTQILYNVPQK